MTNKVTCEISDKLTEQLSAGISDDSTKKLRKQVADLCSEIEDSIQYQLLDNLAPYLSGFAIEMAEKAVESLIEGNEQEMRRYLTCQQGYWNGRNRDHQIIRGKLFEPGCFTVRRQIVEAHRDLIHSERLLDLEDQVRALTEQINHLRQTNERLSDALRGYGI